MLRFQTAKLWTLKRKVGISKLLPVRAQFLSHINAKVVMLKYFDLFCYII